MKALYLITFCVLVNTTAMAEARSIFLNGTDISSSRNQQMKGVNVFIDDDGNIVIDAPQYRVHEESTYTPLSRYSQQKSLMKHKSPIGVSEIPGTAKAIERPKSAELAPAEPMSNDVDAAPKAEVPSVQKQSTVQGAEVKMIEKPGQKVE